MSCCAGPKRRAAYGVLLALLLPLSSHGEALAAPGAADIARARRLFAEATEHEKREEWQLAAPKLEQALAIKETPGLRFHLAHALENMGRLLEAEQEYARSEELIRSGTAAPDVEELLGPAVQSLKERVPTLTIQVSKEATSPRVSLDGVPLRESLLATPLRLDPGEHLIVADAPGRRPFESSLLVSAGEHRVLRVELPLLASGPAPKPSAPAAAASEDMRRAPASFGDREVVIAIELVVAAGGLSFGIYQTTARAKSRNTIESASASLTDASDCNEEQNGPLPDECAALASAIDDYNRAGTLSMVGYSIAAGAVAGAVATWLLWPDQAERPARVGVLPLANGAMTDVLIVF